MAWGRAKAQKNVLVLTYFEPNNKHRHISKHVPGSQKITVRALRSFFVAYDGKQVHIENPLTKEKLSDFDGVYLIGWRIDAQLGMVAGKWLEAHKIPFIGRTVLDIYPSSKLGEMIHLAQKNVAYPKTFYASKAKDLPRLYGWASKKFGLKFPIVVKAIDASMGNHNHLIVNRQGLESLAVKSGKRFMIQEYLPNSFDYRVVVIGNKVQLAIKRIRANHKTHLNNVSKGASSELIAAKDVAPEVKKLSLQAAKVLNRSDISGVDVLFDDRTKKNYILEVNRSPNIAFGADTEEDIKGSLTALYQYLGKLMK